MTKPRKLLRQLVAALDFQFGMIAGNAPQDKRDFADRQVWSAIDAAKGALLLKGKIESEAERPFRGEDGQNKFQRPFRMGDVVLCARKNGDDEDESVPGFGVGKEHIIDDVTLRDGEFMYSTNRGAWFEHGQFDLVRKCDAKSIKELQRAIDREDGEEAENQGDLEDARKAGVQAAREGKPVDGADYEDQDLEVAWFEGFSEEKARLAQMNKPKPAAKKPATKRKTRT